MRVVKMNGSKLWSWILSDEIRPEQIVFLCLIFTGLHATSFVDFGFSHESWYNFGLWHFVHRSYAHGTSNLLFLFLLAGSQIRISVLEILLLSIFVFCLGFFDGLPYYGSSGIVFLCLGKMLRKNRLLQEYPFFGTEVKLPYLVPTFMVILTFVQANSLQTSVDFLHIYAFLLGVLLAVDEESVQNLTKTVITAP